jgi:hypothetical protein
MAKPRRDPFAAIEKDIRAGSLEAAAHAIEVLWKKGKLTPAERLRAAQMAISVRRGDLGYSMLRAGVLGQTGRPKPSPSVAARSLFAMACVDQGAHDEAVRALDGVDARDMPPEGLEAMVVLHSRAWNWSESGVWANRLSAAGLPDEWRRVGLISCAVALILGPERDYGRAAECLAAASAGSSPSENLPLTREVLFQDLDLAIHRRDAVRGRELLGLAREIVEIEADPHYHLLLDRAEAALARSPPPHLPLLPAQEAR